MVELYGFFCIFLFSFLVFLSYKHDLKLKKQKILLIFAKIKALMLEYKIILCIFLLLFVFTKALEFYHYKQARKIPLTLPIYPQLEIILPNSPKYNELKDILG